MKLDLWITFLSDELKLINQERAYPFWSFGAEVGGYIGMFLGISFMQVGKGFDIRNYIITLLPITGSILDANFPGVLLAFHKKC